MIIKKYCIPLLCTTLAAAVTVNAQQVMLFVKTALEMCYNNVIPSLFVFMVLSSYLGQGLAGYLLSFPMLWYAKLMKINDRKFSASILLAFAGGFAVGAKILKELQDAGYSKNCLRVISPVLINNSFSFCVFAVGTGMLENYYLGIMLCVSLFSASLVTGFILSFLYHYNIVSFKHFETKSKKTFAECVNSSVTSVLSICGFVIFFYVVCNVISLYTTSKNLMNLIYPLLEVTCGCREIALNSGKNAFFICIALSLIPVSTLCQVFHFTHNADITRTLIFSRIIHTPVSLMIFSILCNLFPVASAMLNPQNITVRYFYNTSEISTVLFMLTLSFMLITDKNNLFTKN